jgi:hypothetical protein
MRMRFGKAKRFVIATAATLVVVAGYAAPAHADTATELVDAVHYLTTTTGANGVINGTSLAHDGYYEAFDQFGDFGLTIDGAFALAATKSDNATLQTVVDFINQRKTDASNRTIDDWTGIGTPFAGGGAIGKEALLAEVTGNDPHDFGGHDLIAAVDEVICSKTDVVNGCAAPGNYLYATSTFSQALGVIAQLRAADASNATTPIAYLESLQNAAGAWPSLLPDSGDSDVDSTAMAAMALALVSGDATAATATTKAIAWIASQQQADGGFNGVAGESSNSVALAIQGLTLAGSTYATEIGSASAFLVGQQNADGGFDVGPGGQQGSDVRATAQIVSGIVGTSFGTLSDVVIAQSGGGTTTTTTVPVTTSTIAVPGTTSTTVVTPVTGTDVEPISDPATTLPVTGSGAAGLLGVSVGLIGLGLGATRLGRRRGNG